MHSIVSGLCAAFFLFKLSEANMAGIKKRGRGRPDRMSKLLHDLQMNVVKGQEDLVNAYPQAINLLITIMNNESASPTNRLSAAKTIKEYVETSLEMYEKDDEDDGNSSEEDDGKPAGLLLKIE
jgi:hypothetical protein